MRLILAALLLAAAPVGAATLDIPSGAYVADPTHTSVTWRIMHFGLSNYTARFAKVAATVDLDAADVAKSKLAVTIDPKSVKTDFPFADKLDFDAEIGGDPRFLDGTKFPEIKFVATKITVGAGKAAKIVGDLTLRGVTKPIVLDVVLNGAVKAAGRPPTPRLGVSATGMVKRADYGMTFGDGFLGGDIQLLIEAEFVPAK